MHEHEEESFALLKLILAGGGVAPRRALLDAHGAPARSLAAGASAWRAAGLSETQIQRIRQPDGETLQRALQWLEHARHHLLGWHDPDYPPLLRRIGSPPLALFVDGDPSLLWHAGVAIVGSRSPTAGGRDNAYSFARAFAASGTAVISGMAAGIDAAAHEAALSVPQGVTVAVLGTGPDLAYPPHHAGLRERIAARGAVVSEHPPGTAAKPAHFPSRNRILAGLALGTLVVEATERSGALITARQAGDNGREVFAVPGSIHNPMARGCHRLIREGAGLVENAQEVLDALVPMASELADFLRGRLAGSLARPHIGADAALAPLNPDYQPLWLALGHDPTGMDLLVERTGLTAAELSSMLLVMELDGRVAVEHGRYSRKT
ncbi:DNA-processing protein DprA [Pseudoxanthomonas sacheonensis]|uniref:DNA-processing protein DprA n=1 Tax=Pseudoxanthomonas sacheonensis TaxID=443615 RepID=UPI0013D6196F|nr:DNA-processing protein DprA [Pseudoxanthomonas sacheonensis]KAF1710806.1 DNA-protecting protein DprA [Pseudoxanthomonas sacheonensis]